MISSLAPEKKNFENIPGSAREVEDGSPYKEETAAFGTDDAMDGA